MNDRVSSNCISKFYSRNRGAQVGDFRNSFGYLCFVPKSLILSFNITVGVNGVDLCVLLLQLEDPLRVELALGVALKSPVHFD